MTTGMFRKPMLAPNRLLDHEEMISQWPVLASEKLNGMRIIIVNGDIRSRNGKVPRNEKFHAWIRPIVEWSRKRECVLDGEVYSHQHRGSKISGIVNSLSKDIPLGCRFKIFDCLRMDEWLGVVATPAFAFRVFRMKQWKMVPLEMEVLKQEWVNDWSGLVGLFAGVIAADGEGLIVRDPYGRYKHGRCTVNEGCMFKMKSFDVVEGIVMNQQPLKRMKDDLDRSVDVYGHRERMGKISDLWIDDDRLGSYECILDDGSCVSVGSGFDDSERLKYAGGRLIGKRIRIRCTMTDRVDRVMHPSFVCVVDDKENS